MNEPPERMRSWIRRNRAWQLFMGVGGASLVVVLFVWLWIDSDRAAAAPILYGRLRHAND
jgi:hypothetical protein